MTSYYPIPPYSSGNKYVPYAYQPEPVRVEPVRVNPTRVTENPEEVHFGYTGMASTYTSNGGPACEPSCPPLMEDYEETPECPDDEEEGEDRQVEGRQVEGRNNKNPPRVRPVAAVVAAAGLAPIPPPPPPVHLVPVGNLTWADIRREILDLKKFWFYFIVFFIALGIRSCYYHSLESEEIERALFKVTVNQLEYYDVEDVIRDVTVQHNNQIKAKLFETTKIDCDKSDLEDIFITSTTTASEIGASLANKDRQMKRCRESREETISTLMGQIVEMPAVQIRLLSLKRVCTDVVCKVWEDAKTEMNSILEKAKLQAVEKVEREFDRFEVSHQVMEAWKIIKELILSGDFTSTDKLWTALEKSSTTLGVGSVTFFASGSWKMMKAVISVITRRIRR